MTHRSLTAHPVQLEDGNNIVLNKNGTVSILAEDGRELENIPSSLRSHLRG